MIFRTINGELVELNRYSYTNDKIYYKEILNIKIPILELINPEIREKNKLNTKNNTNKNEQLKNMFNLK